MNLQIKFMITAITLVMILNEGLSQKEISIIDSLNIYLFPQNIGVEQYDTLHIFEKYENEKIYIIGRTNQPKKKKAEKIFEKIRKEQMVSLFPDLKKMYRKYEDFFIEEWGEGIRHYDRISRSELLFFRNFEMTLFSLYIDLSFLEVKDRYKHIKQSHIDLYKNKTSNIYFSDYFERYGNKSNGNERTYLVEHIDELQEFVLEDLRKFQIPKNNNPLFYFYFSALSEVAEYIDLNIDLEAIIIERYNYLKEFNGEQWYNILMAKRGTIKGVQFIVDILLQNESFKQEDFIKARHALSYIYTSPKGIRNLHEILFMNLNPEQFIKIVEIMTIGETMNVLQIESAKNKNNPNYKARLVYVINSLLENVETDEYTRKKLYELKEKHASQ